MDMKILKSEKRLCTCCMEEHEVKTVLVMDKATFKNTEVDYEAYYLYCDLAEELYMDEKQMQDNDTRMKDSYREKKGLLTSTQISGIRAKYGISQSDLCVLLGWGGKTITRYESHQVQDKAHDTILKKIDQDPEWFLSLLNDAKDSLSAESYQKYMEAATSLFEEDQDAYLRKAIEASYAGFQGNKMFHGNTSLSLDKVVDVIRYFAVSSKVTSLYKVKLMKLMWYADALAYKRRGRAITGLVYRALPMGAVCTFAISPTERVRETFSYFSLIPFGYANFAPLITAILTVVVLLLSLISLKKDSVFNALFVLSIITAIISLMPLMYGLNNYSLVGALITIALVTESIFVKTQQK